MKHKRILAMLLAVASCLSLAVSASAASTARKATDFKDYDRTAWYAEAVSAAVDNGLLYGKSSTIIDPNGDMTRAEMAAIINRSFGCYVKADISKYKDVSKDKWYYNDVALAVQMGTYNGRSSSSMAPDSPITRQEAMTVVARALELDYDAYAKTDLSAFSDRSDISSWALPYVRAMIGADYIHGRGKILAPQDNITRAEFAQIFYNIIGTYIVTKGTYVTVVLTLACGKYRFNDLDLGSINGLPRLMDVGQCNDAYSAIQIAVALADAFGCGVNDLPLSMVLSWYEQKAVCILLTLLHLGIKNIRLGPTLPAFVSSNVLNYLVENFGIAPITTPEEDLKQLLK